MLGVSTLLSEASPLIVGPWLVLVVAAVRAGVARSRVASGCAMGLCTVPSLVTLGRARGDRAEGAIRPSRRSMRAAPAEIEGHGSVFPYLSDTFRSSFERVIHGPGNKPFSTPRGRSSSLRSLLYCARGCLPYIARDVDVDPAHPVRCASHGRRQPSRLRRCCSRSGSTGCVGSVRSASRRCSPAVRSCCSTAARRSARRAARRWHRPVPSEVSRADPRTADARGRRLSPGAGPAPNFIKNVGRRRADAAQRAAVAQSDRAVVVEGRLGAAAAR